MTSSEQNRAHLRVEHLDERIMPSHVHVTVPEAAAGSPAVQRVADHSPHATLELGITFVYGKFG